MADMKMEVDYTSLTKARKELEKMLKLVFQLEHQISKSWLLRMIFGMRLQRKVRHEQNKKNFR